LQLARLGAALLRFDPPLALLAPLGRTLKESVRVGNPHRRHRKVRARVEGALRFLSQPHLLL
jgi:hypothetical protein